MILQAAHLHTGTQSSRLLPSRTLLSLSASYRLFYHVQVAEKKACGRHICLEKDRSLETQSLGCYSIKNSSEGPHRLFGRLETALPSAEKKRRDLFGARHVYRSKRVQYSSHTNHIPVNGIVGKIF